MTTARQLIDEARRRLDGAGIETAALDARLLLQTAAGLSHAAIVADPHRAIGAAQMEQFAALLGRRLRHEPVSRILGEREFFGRRFSISGAVLDPRPDSETLIDAALQHMGPGDRILDLGTGSGALIVTLLAEVPKATGVATDVSAAALAVALGNADCLGVSQRCEAVESDWFSAVAGVFDLIVCNPPYIPAAAIAELARDVRDYDPRQALDGGTEGLDAYKAISAGASPHLRPGGYLLVEIGAGQESAVTALFEERGFALLQRCNDLGGHVRCLVFTKH